MKFSRDWKNFIDIQSDVLGGGEWGYFKKVKWTFCVKESICVRPLTNVLLFDFDILRRRIRALKFMMIRQT